MCMIAASFRRTHSPSRLAWSEGWRTPGAQSAFIRWTGWSLAMTRSRWQHHKHCHGYYYYAGSRWRAVTKRTCCETSGQLSTFRTNCRCFGISSTLPLKVSLACLSCCAFSALTLLTGRQEEHPACKNSVSRSWCGYLSGVRCWLFPYGPADATASPNRIVSCLI